MPQHNGNPNHNCKVIDKGKTMSENPKVTVIMPSYNVGPYIKQCIQSVIDQTLKEIEIICIDSGSTDGTLEILNDYSQKDSRILLLHSDMKSYGHQVNMGLAKANGEYIGIVETDDFIDPHMFEDLYNLTQNGKIDVVKGNFWKYYSEDPATPPVRNAGWSDIPTGTVISLKTHPTILRGHPSIWSAIYRRGFLTSINYQFVEERGGGWVDNPFFFETLCAAESIVWTRTPYYFYRQTNPNSSSNNLSDLTLPFRRMSDNLDVIDKYNVEEETALKCTYGRAFAYILDVQKKEEFYYHQDDVVPYIQDVVKRLDRDVVIKNFNYASRALYYKYRLPVQSVCPVNGKILIYNDEQLDFVNKNTDAGKYIASLINEISHTRPDITICYLFCNQKENSGRSGCFIRHANGPAGTGCKFFEVINPPRGSSKSLFIHKNGEDPRTSDFSKAFENFLKNAGPFDMIDFVSSDFIPYSAFNIKSKFADTKIFFTVHTAANVEKFLFGTTGEDKQINNNVDYYFAVSELAKKTLIENGIDEQKIIDTPFSPDDSYEKLKKCIKDQWQKAEELVRIPKAENVTLSLEDFSVILEENDYFRTKISHIKDTELELQGIVEGKSYKIARLITVIPRKIREFLNKLKSIRS